LLHPEYNEDIGSNYKDKTDLDDAAENSEDSWKIEQRAEVYINQVEIIAHLDYRPITTAVIYSLHPIIGRLSAPSSTTTGSLTIPLTLTLTLTLTLILAQTSTLTPTVNSTLTLTETTALLLTLS
jgi:hypothetical protein